MLLILLVGVRGFEPPAPASRRQCSTRLSYTPTVRLPIKPTGGVWQGLKAPAGQPSRARNTEKSAAITRKDRLSLPGAPIAA